MTTKRNRLHAIMKSLTYGVEIETCNAGKRRLGHAISAAMAGSSFVMGTGWMESGTHVLAADGRRWNLVRDGSIDGDNGCEIVTPILRYNDMADFQNIIRAARHSVSRGGAGARVDSSCGVHIHVGAAPFVNDPKALIRLIKLVNQQEDLFFQAIGTRDDRRSRWTKPMDPEFVRKIDRMRNPTIDKIKKAWYGSAYNALVGPTDRYHHSRYRGFNLHALFNKGTVEFRYFESTLHAGKIKAYVQFFLALCARALVTRSARASKRKMDRCNHKFAIRTFMLRCELIGEEFATCRLHMMALMPGDAANARKGIVSVRAPAA